MSETQNRIECKYTEYQIRILYAKHINGLGKNDIEEDISPRCLKEAMQEDYQKVIKRLVKHWDYFKKKHQFRKYAKKAA